VLLGLKNDDNNNNNPDNVYGALIMIKALARVHPVHLMNFGNREIIINNLMNEHRVAANLQNWLPSTSTIAVVIITQPIR